MAGGWKAAALRIARAAASAAAQSATAPRRTAQRRSTTRGRSASPPPRPAPPSGARRLDYAPDLDGRADAGEIVWTWVPYEDDASRGKDRPVLVVGRDGATLHGLMLSSQDERAGQRDWHPLGTGDWDREGRPSWVRLDRVIEVAEDGIRREGAVLDRGRFDQVAGVLRARYGWS
jgi:hypothetical protein